ncbi:hypothetical protein LCGC14_1696690 [marine sediment metagenome]|uniref:Uncharacterized protein n=1 Tax=marine sediment metagenome TaxID=412755 RepID=A0A0F9JZQ5_9ZZZZ
MSKTIKAACLVLVLGFVGCGETDAQRKVEGKKIRYWAQSNGGGIYSVEYRDWRGELNDFKNSDGEIVAAKAEYAPSGHARLIEYYKHGVLHDPGNGEAAQFRRGGQRGHYQEGKLHNPSPEVSAWTWDRHERNYTHGLMNNTPMGKPAQTRLQSDGTLYETRYCVDGKLSDYGEIPAIQEYWGDGSGRVKKYQRWSNGVFQGGEFKWMSEEQDCIGALSRHTAHGSMIFYTTGD